ncbi:hypothetical protein ACIA8R_39590 [Nonomuraea sp. NPDC051191]|uniref:hypothetical protein n=1 Tax=Nonomuraea sp. NPDC051191 TaxID=3364372 RepID=UPI003795231B
MTREQLEQALRGAEALAEQARADLDGAVALMSQSVWTGPAADQFGQELAGQRQAVMGAFTTAISELRMLLARTPADAPQ